MQTRGVELVSVCWLCRNSVESLSHLFIDCIVVQRVWEYFAGIFDIHLPRTSEVKILIQYWRYSTAFHGCGHIRLLLPLFICWFGVPETKHQGVVISANSIIWKVLAHLQLMYRTNMFSANQWRGDLSAAERLGFHLRQVSKRQSVVVFLRKPEVKKVGLN